MFYFKKTVKGTYMEYKIMKMNDFNFIKFIHEIENKYGHQVAVNVASSLLNLANVANKTDYLNELNSPRYIMRMKWSSANGMLIIETINNNFKGYRYTVTPSKVNRKKVNYD